MADANIDVQVIEESLGRVLNRTSLAGELTGDHKTRAMCTFPSRVF